MEQEAAKTAAVPYRDQCRCGPCPSYTECMRSGEELVFCLAGRSPDCMFDKRGCLCPACPVQSALGFRKAYYCARGNARELG
ncbi:MAG TPA: DUF2769 domain-containing protein [Methanoregula sp.]|nr:DUF2769 domain-containing protein [Methanoregula sp.]